jgi:hypothetical protein
MCVCTGPFVSIVYIGPVLALSCSLCSYTGLYIMSYPTKRIRSNMMRLMGLWGLSNMVPIERVDAVSLYRCAVRVWSVSTRWRRPKSHGRSSRVAFRWG